MENIDIRYPSKLTHNQIQKVGKITTAFLNSKTSTVRGIKDINKKRGNNLMEGARELGINLTDKDMSRLVKVLSSSTYKKLMELAIPSNKVIPLLTEVVSFKTMGEKGRSLNLGISVGIVLYEALRQNYEGFEKITIANTMEL